MLFVDKDALTIVFALLLREIFYWNKLFGF